MDQDDTEKLVFREVKGTSVTTLTPNSKVVDINIHQQALEKLHAGNLKDTAHILTVCWDSVEYQQYASTCEIHFPSRRDITVKTVVSRLVEQQYLRLQSLIETIYQKFNTRVAHVHHNPLTFGLLHRTLDSFKQLEANMIPLETLFMTLYVDISKARLQLKLVNKGSELSLPDDNEGPKEESANSNDEFAQETKSVSREANSVQHPSDLKKEAYETERQFQEIERHLKDQRDAMNIKLHQHEEQYEQMNTSLQTLLKLVVEKQNSGDKVPATQQPSTKSTQNSDINEMSTSETDSSSFNDSNNPISDDENDSSTKRQVHGNTMSKSDITMFSEVRDHSFSNDSTQSASDRGLTGMNNMASNETSLMSESASMSKSRDHTFKGVTGVSYSSRDTSLPSDRTTYTSESMIDSASANSSRSDITGTSSSHSRVPPLAATNLQENSSVTSETTIPTRSTVEMGGRSDRNGDIQVPLLEERSDHTQPLEKKTTQRGGPTSTPNAEETKIAHVSANEPRVATPDTAGRPVDSSKSSVEEHPLKEWFNGSVGKGGGNESIQDVLSATEEAMIDDVVMPPKGQGLDTVLCLDTSHSMGEEGLREVKEIALDFIDGIEDVASSHDIEENIAVVRLGGRPRIVHHLSNDYTNVREVIENLELGGQTPLVESLQICLCSVQGGRGSIVNIGGCHMMSPRVIVITDGKPTEGYGGSFDVDNVQQNVTMNVVKVVSEFKTRRNSPEFPKPFIWIPAGQANRKFLKSLSELSGGVYIEGKNVRNLCNYQQIQVTIGKVFAYLQSDMNIESGGDTMETALDIFASDLDQESKDSVIKGVQAKLDGEDGCGNINVDNTDFSNVVEYENLPPLGTRVARGPDWNHGNQDSEGPGTIYQHLEDKGLVLVRWDNGMTEKYCYGVNGRYEVWEVTDQPRCAIGDEIEIGCEVTRGPDWTAEYSEQDGGAGCVGVVIRKDDDYGVKVRWRETCFVGIYRYQKERPRDVLLRDPLDILKEITQEEHSDNETKEIHNFGDGDLVSLPKVWTWKWVDDSNIWHEYPPEIVEKLEKAHGSQRSCLFVRNHQSYRVLFKDMVEKGIDTRTRRKVSRTSKPLDVQ